MPIEKSIDNFNKEVPIFLNYIEPLGGLTKERESQCCFYYYLLAMNMYEMHTDLIVMEGDPDPEVNYRNLFETLCKLYEVKPEAVAKCWTGVDTTCFMFGLPKLPDERRYRHDHKMEIIS